MKQDKQVFSVEINKGPTQTIKTRSGLYILAAAAALANLEYEPYEEAEGADIVKIWMPGLLPHYGPYFYAFHEGSIFHLIESLNPKLVW